MHSMVVHKIILVAHGHIFYFNNHVYIFPSFIEIQLTSNMQYAFLSVLD